MPKAGAISEEELADVRVRFNATARLHRSDQLDLPRFRDLVNEVLLEVVGEQEDRLPTPADLSEAFTLADADMSGLVDEEEFVTLYGLIRQGAVKGLGKKGMFASMKKGSFKKSFTQAPARLSQELPPQPLIEEETTADSVDKDEPEVADGLTEVEIEAARDRFQEACDAEGADELDKPAFAALVLALLEEESSASSSSGGATAMPSEDDLSVAFTLADADQSGKTIRAICIDVFFSQSHAPSMSMYHMFCYMSPCLHRQD